MALVPWADMLNHSCEVRTKHAFTGDGCSFTLLIYYCSLFQLYEASCILACVMQVETFLDYDKTSRGVVFTTDRSYQPGEQVIFKCISFDV